jgi:hypothetical protein
MSIHRRARPRRVAVAVLVAAMASTSLTSIARADESDGARLFREGRELMLDGRFAQACPKLEESQRLEPHTGTILNLGACHERLGKVASAWIEYQTALTAAHAEGQTERERLAQDRISAVEPRVPWITIDVRDASRSMEGLVVTLDGAAIRSAAFGKEMPVDPGPHVVVAIAPARKRFEMTADLHESERRVVTIAALESDESSGPKPTTLIVDGGERDKREAREPQKATADERTRVVLEIGPMFGFMSVHGLAKPHVSSVTLAPSSPPGSAGTTSCASQSCTVDVSNGGVFLGLTGFLGYAVTDALHLGARFIGGARMSEGGGDLIAAGPGVSYRIGGPLRVGASLLLGTAVVSGPRTVTVPAGFRATSDENGSRARGDLAFAGGADVELDWELAKIGNGGLNFAVTPVFIAGPTGSAFSVPLGLVYRSR